MAYYCPKCDKEVETSVLDKVETYPVLGEDTVILATVRYCDECGEEIWDDKLDSENLRQAFNEYRRNHYLLTPDKVRMMRECYMLNQESFSKILGFSNDRIKQIENGSIQKNFENNLLILCQSPHNFYDVLNRNREELPAEEYEKSRDKVFTMMLKEMV